MSPISLLLSLSLPTFADPPDVPPARIEVCHWTPAGASVIKVFRKTVPMHFAHGDSYPETYYADVDGDGWGDALGTTDRCPNQGFVADATDCNDADAGIFPTNDEADDLIDNDCDHWVDEDFVSEGDLLLTEVARQPRFGGTASVAAGQWFEVANVSDRTLDLSYWYVMRTNGGANTDAFFVDPSWGVLLAPGEAAVFCKTDDYEGNADATYPLWCDYVWGDETQPSTWSSVYHDNTFNLQRDLDRLAIFVEGGSLYGRLVDDVTWTWTATDNEWPRDASYSMSLDPSSYDHEDNDEGPSWCSTPASADYTWWVSGTLVEYGTPGEPNASCE